MTASEQYLGTCSEPSEEELEQIVTEQEIERCETCGWWCEISEMDENNNCDDCRVEGDED